MAIRVVLNCRKVSRRITVTGDKKFEWIVEDDDVYDDNDINNTCFYTPAKSLSVYEVEELRTMRVEKRFSQF